MFDVEWFTALGVIIVVDLLLAGDNAVVIALAARQLPPKLQKRAIYLGTFGAILVRSLLVLVALSLLEIGGIRLVGGLLLFAIAYKMLGDSHSNKSIKPVNGFWGAMTTIIIADTVMGVDNILAIAGASRGDVWLVGIGFAISIPIMIGGSIIIIKWIERFPILITMGCALLAGIGGRMVIDDKWIAPLITENGVAQWAGIVCVAVIWTGICVAYKKRKKGNIAI